MSNRYSIFGIKYYGPTRTVIYITAEGGLSKVMRKSILMKSALLHTGHCAAEEEKLLLIVTSL